MFPGSYFPAPYFPAVYWPRPGPGSNNCVVGFTVYLNGVPVQGARITAAVVEVNSSVGGKLLSRQGASTVTDSSGNATLALVPETLFTHGDGLYDVVIASPDGTIMTQVRVGIPNVPAISFDSLLP